jgi:hypothetical protein
VEAKLVKTEPLELKWRKFGDKRPDRGRSDSEDVETRGQHHPLVSDFELWPSKSGLHMMNKSLAKRAEKLHSVLKPCDIRWHHLLQKTDWTLFQSINHHQTYKQKTVLNKSSHYQLVQSQHSIISVIYVLFCFSNHFWKKLQSSMHFSSLSFAVLFVNKLWWGSFQCGTTMWDSIIL